MISAHKKRGSVIIYEVFFIINNTDHITSCIVPKTTWTKFQFKYLEMKYLKEIVDPVAPNGKKLYRKQLEGRTSA